MSRVIRIVMLGALLALVATGGAVFARGGARGGGGGFRGGGGGGGGFRGGYGGMSSMGRTPSFSSAGSFNRGGAGFGNRGSYGGMNGGQINSGSRSGSYTTNRGSTINYGAAGVGARGPGGFEAGRGVYGAQVNTAGGRTLTGAGTVGGVAGPGGNAAVGRAGIGAVSDSRGTVVAGSRGFAAAGAGGAVAGRSYGAAGFRPNGYNAYGGYHQGWVHGYWNGHNDAAWGWRNPYWGWGAAGVGVGLGLGWGLSSWGFGSSLYGMGYLPYTNPYYGAGFVDAGQAVPYDYSLPIDTVSAPADPSIADPSVALFDAARASFQQGDYPSALKQTNDALAKLPGDTTLHEFRALCLFAIGRYDEAAATLYAVLSVGPGWDWTTMIGLYPDVEVYTAQQRALENYCVANPGSSTGRFVLAYHYLTQGHTDAAVNMLKGVVQLNPSDKLSARLLAQLDPPKAQEATPAAPTPVAADTTPPAGATIAGAWRANPAPDTSIALTIQPGGAFTWQATVKGRTQQFQGSSTFGDGILTLAQDSGPALVGRVGWTDPARMTFRVVGDGPDDPGLSFAK